MGGEGSAARKQTNKHRCRSSRCRDLRGGLEVSAKAPKVKALLRRALSVPMLILLTAQGRNTPSLHVPPENVRHRQSFGLFEREAAPD